MSGSDDEIDEAYRRASADDASRPAAATRAAILTRAHAVAAEQRAAANEPWFRRRSIAGIAASLAVVGIAAILWRQGARDPQVRVAAGPDAAASARAPAAPLSRDQQVEAADEAAREFRAEQNAATRSLSRAAPLAESADTRALVEREFPGLLQAADPPRALWLLLDADGQTLRTGLLGDEEFGALTARLRQEMPNRRIEAFVVEAVATGDGRSVQVGVARAR